jgi:hypothetical protein
MDCIYDWFLWIFPKPATENQPNEEDDITSSVYANESESAVSPGKGEESNIELDHSTIEPLMPKENCIFSKNNPEKLALLIGINYNTNEAENDDLNGCENDMNRLAFWVENSLSFNSEKIVKLDSVFATKDNIINEIKKMVIFANTHKNTELWFSYSGHGSNYNSATESDGKNEIICPSDYAANGFISDDWLKNEFINKLPNDCKMFVMMDCCHSGSNMDLPYCLNTDGWIESRNMTKETVNNINSMPKVIKLSGCLDEQVSMDYYNREMKEFQGAFTNAFMKSFENKVIISDHRNLNLFLRESKFKQVSELAMSDPSMWSWRLCEE